MGDGWGVFVYSKGLQNMDPELHDVDTLKEFLVALETGLIDYYLALQPVDSRLRQRDKSFSGYEDVAKIQLVEQVKTFMSRGDVFNQSWFSFLRHRGETHYDP